MNPHLCPPRSCSCILSSLAATLCIFAVVETPARASLVAYYTLDNLTSGVQNLGTDGATSDLTAPDAGSTPTEVSSGVIGGALSFDGNDILRSITAGNAADDLTAFPFTMSVWMRSVVQDTTRDTVLTLSDRAEGGRYWGTGVENLTGGRAEPELVRRNSGFTELNATGADARGSQWVHVFAVFNPTSSQIYVGGKLVATASFSEAFNASVDTLSIGGFLRNKTTTTPTDPFSGQADDIGLFDTALVPADAALINGLGLTGGIGLDQLDEAEALDGMAVGSTATVGGVEWKKVSGLGGALGDFGGTVSGGDAFIVTDGAGNGIQVIPEPVSGGLMLVGMLGLGVVRRRRRFL